MAPRSTRHLKLFSDAAAQGQPEHDENPLAELERLGRSLTAATGWTFRFVPGRLPPNDPILQWSAPVDPGVGAAPGYLRMDRDGGGSSRRIGAAEAQRIAEEWIGLFCERVRLRRSLREREAELAAGVPIKPRRQGQAHLADRLSAILRGGAQGLGCDAAAMYLLNDATTELKLRAQWGLPEAQLDEPARELRGALGDLEALSGHVVVLEDDALFDLWRVPQRFGAAVCAPISSPSTILGTLWLFSSQPRDFAPRETNMIEILAGSLAAELDREVLCNQAVAERRFAAATRPPVASPFAAVPSTAPLLSGWDVAARVLTAEGAAGSTSAGCCIDWRLGTDGSLRAIVSHAGPDEAGAATAAALRGAWHVATEHGDDPAAVLDALGRWIWTASAGDVRAAATVLQLRTNGEVQLAAAGQTSAFVVRRSGVMEFATAGALAAGQIESPELLLADPADLTAPALGREPEPQYPLSTACIAAGDTLVVMAQLDRSTAPLAQPGSASWATSAALFQTPLSVRLADACRAAAGPVTAAEYCRSLEQQWQAAAALEDYLPAGDVAVLVARRRDLTGVT